MFSRRLPWDAPVNRLTGRLRERVRAGFTVLDLTVSNPTSAGIPYPGRAILEAVASEEGLLYTPEPRGSLAAREAIARRYAGEGYSVDPGALVLCSSTSEAYAWLFRLLADPGDEVLVPAPSYPLFEFLAGLEGVRVASYPLAYRDGWELDADEIAERLGDRTRAVVLVHPNNPTGSYVKRHELQALRVACAGREVALIADEVFYEYPLRIDPHRAATLATEDELPAFALGGLSKSCGLPQMKLAWIALAGPRAFRERAGAALEWIADTYLPVSAPVQAAAPALLELGREVRDVIRGRTARNLAALAQRVGSSSACSVLDVEGGWSAVVRLPAVHDAGAWAERLLDGPGILVQPGYFYDFAGEAYVVVSLLTPVREFDAGIAALVECAAIP